MDVLLGITLKDGALIATSKAAVRGISILKATDDKTRALNDHSLMAFTGEAGDTVQFAEYIQANIQLFGTRNAHELSPHAVASFVRNQLAESLRSRKPYQVNLLLGGYDIKTDKASLNWIDYLGTNASIPYAAHGYAAYYTLSLLDRHYKDGMSLEEGLEVLKLCVAELDRRMPVDFKGVYVKFVTKKGIIDVDFE